jgi:hypothetical protein
LEEGKGSSKDVSREKFLTMVMHRIREMLIRIARE